jgi:DNA-binding NarL/FixJ family response regulator
LLAAVVIMNEKVDIVSGTAKAAADPLRVFLVEDSPAVRAFIVENVGGIEGVSIAGCSDTEIDALQKLRRQVCDVLIMDIELKQGNGMSLLRTLCNSRLQPGILKIVFSNHINGVYRRIGEQYGVHFFFDKTTDFLRLRALLEQLGAASRDG